jgi:tRNA threonylcarbamoyladenosine biosynthesis protein TsaB
MLLAIETSDRLCGACVLDESTGGIVATKTIDIGKGHAELLMGVIEDVLRQGDLAYANLTKIAVCVGPGSFTGIRVGVSAALGFSIALDIPVLGVTSLQGLALEHTAAASDILCLIDAHRGDVYAQSFSAKGLPLNAPAQISLDEFANMPALQSSLLCGSGVVVLQALFPDLNLPNIDRALLSKVESIAQAASDAAMCVEPKPLYLRRPDAKPQESYTLARALR